MPYYHSYCNSELIRALLTFSILDYDFHNMENVKVLLGSSD
jgi:hypothetical protein